MTTIKTHEQIAKDNEILLTRVGSHLYGTSTPDSDEDFVGLFVPSRQMLYGMDDCKQVSFRTNPDSSGEKNTSDDKDIIYYTIRRFFELAVKNNPNVVELFFADKDNIVNGGRYWDAVSKNSHLFISKLVFDSFMGYAESQEEKMVNKTERYKSIIEAEKFLKNLLDMKIDKFNPEHILTLCTLTENYKNTKNQERQYHTGLPIQKVYDNISAEIDRYGHRSENIIKYGYEVKFGSHLVRLLAEGIELAETGSIAFPLKIAPTIKSIKNGDVPLKDALEIIACLKQDFRRAEEKSELRDEPDIQSVNELLIDITHDFLQGGNHK